MHRDVCRLVRADDWKPKAYPGRAWEFVVFDCGVGYFFMRLFDTAKQRDYWIRRNRKWNTGVTVQSHGRIRWKV